MNTNLRETNLVYDDMVEYNGVKCYVDEFLEKGIAIRTWVDKKLLIVSWETKDKIKVLNKARMTLCPSVGKANGYSTALWH